MFANSIRWRLQSWLAFLLVCVLTGFGVTAYQLQRVNRLKQIDEELERRLAVLARAVRGGPPPRFGPRRPGFEGRPGMPDYDDGTKRPLPPNGGPGAPPPGRPPDREPRPGEFRLSPEAAGLFDQTQTNGFYFVVWSREEALIQLSTNAPADTPLPKRLRADTRTHTRVRDPFREAYYFTELGDCVLAGRDIAADLRALHQFSFWLLAAGGAVLAAGLGGGWWLTTRAIRPVEEISAAASRISAGNLAERIRTADPDNELGRLATVLNSTFARLESAFAQQKQFTADASHELRTPLAVIISETQTALARPRNAGEYRETVEACLETAQQMKALTESLLELARLDARQEPVRGEELNLAEATRTCIERIRPLATECNLVIHEDLAPARISGNLDQIGQVITNLLTNAIGYNRPNGGIRVGTRSENGAASLTVADTGVGISSEDLPHIFERFYRADKSRARAQGRAGLGLAISKAIVEAHGGSIGVTSELGVGTTFTVRFPT